MAMSADEARRRAFPATNRTMTGGWHHSPEYFRLRYGSQAPVRRVEPKRRLQYTSGIGGHEVCVGMS